MLWLKKTRSTTKLHTENKLRVFTPIFDYLMAFFCISTPFRRKVQPTSAGWPVWVKWVLKWLGTKVRVSVISAVPDSSWCRVLLVAPLWPFLNGGGGGGGLSRIGGVNCACTSSGINPFCLYDSAADTFHDSIQFCSLCATVYSNATICCTVQKVTFPTALALLWLGSASSTMWSETSWGLQFVVGAAAHAEHVNSAALARDFEHVWKSMPRTSLEGRGIPVRVSRCIVLIAFWQHSMKLSEVFWPKYRWLLSCGCQSVVWSAAAYAGRRTGYL